MNSYDPTIQTARLPFRIFVSAGFTAMVLSVTAFATSAATPAAAPAAPEAQQVQAFVVQFFQSSPDYLPGDLITRSATQKLFRKMRSNGWAIDDEKEILDRTLPDDDILVQQFRTKKGRVFWSKIQNLPGGIDRVDRLARMPQGQANVRALIQKVPDGYKWIEGMTTTRRGERLGDRLSKSSTGRNFNKPTDRIYTAEMLAEQLAGQVTFGSSSTTR